MLSNIQIEGEVKRVVDGLAKDTALGSGTPLQMACAQSPLS